MAAPLSEIVPILLNSSNSKTSSSKASSIKIPLGDVTTALFNCIHAMHTQNYLFQDVKPDNFMLAANSSSTTSNNRGKKKSSSSNSNNNNNKEVANRIRLIDFGLVERYSEMASTSHREDAYPSAQLVGTPTYASLNVMGGHTPSRRDDLEALGYVICELILLLVRSSSGGGSGGGSGSGGRKRKGKSGDDEDEGDVLPWSHAKSDKELYQIKQEEMNKSKRSKSSLFNELKGAGEGVVDVQMAKYFNEVMNLEYAEKPDYDSLRGHLSKIVVTIAGGAKKVAATRGGAKKAAAASPKKPAAAAAATAAPGKSPRRYPSRRTKEKEQSSSQSSVSSNENVENCKKQKVSSRTIATQTDDNDDEMICLLDDDSSENEVEDMDWELLDNDGNNTNVANNVPAVAAAGRTKSAFLKLEVISGSQKGQEVSFGDDYPDAVVVGRDPGSSTAKALKDSAKLALTMDDNVSSVHAKFVITSKKNMHSVRVTDMSSSSSSDSATLVNGMKLASGKSRQAFVGDKITVGGSILQVKRA